MEKYQIKYLSGRNKACDYGRGRGDGKMLLQKAGTTTIKFDYDDYRRSGGVPKREGNAGLFAKWLCLQHSAQLAPLVITLFTLMLQL